MNLELKDISNQRSRFLTRIVRRRLVFDTPRHPILLIVASSILILFMSVGCGTCNQDLEAVEYTSLPGDDWKVSTPAEQGLDPMLVAKLYSNAGRLEILYGLLVVKNGYLIAERYFNEGSVGQKARLQSVTLLPPCPMIDNRVPCHT
jgi:hypothetical protein